MIETKVVNQALRARNKKLIDWGLSVETAGSIDLMQELLNRITFDLGDKSNSAQALLIGILRKHKVDLLNLSATEIKDFIDDGFFAMQERKRKRLKTGIITRNTFESEFQGGGDIFDWLLENSILKRIAPNKGYFKNLTEDQRILLESNFPDNFARILVILELSQDLKITQRTKYFYEVPGIQSWRNI